MELHMRGIAPFLSDEALKKTLEPEMASLGIPSHAFACEKYRQQRWANVTFLEMRQGQAFFQKYGEQQIPVPNTQHGQPPFTTSSTQGSVNGSVNGSTTGSTKGHVSKSTKESKVSGVEGPGKNQGRKQGRNKAPRRRQRLRIAGEEVIVGLSKPHGKDGIAGQPNTITLRGLKYAAEETVKPSRKIEKEFAPNVFEVQAFSCGHLAFDRDILVFIPEAEYRDDFGTAKFTKNTLLIKLRSGLVIRISTNAIINLTCSFDRILTLTLTEVPSFFRESTAGSSRIGDRFAAMNLSGSQVNLDATRIRIGSLDDRHSHIVGHCLVYQFQVTGPDLPQQIRALSTRDNLPFQRFILITQRTPPPHLRDTRQAMADLMFELAENLQKSQLPFGILFQLQALAYNAFLHPGTVLELTRQLNRKFKSDRSAGKRLISTSAFKKLFNQIGWPKPHGNPSHFEVGPIIDLLIDIEKEMQNETALQRDLLLPSQNLASIYRITVTPSRITLHGPEQEAKNRILRKYPNHHEYFIRVQFCDENGQDLYFNAKVSYDEIWNRFKRVFASGIQVAGRTYSFLGFSHSSLRSHSAWFSAPFVDDHENFQTYFSIIRALGDFHDIRSPAKCAARIGQAFSETPFALSLDEHEIVIAEIPDVTSADGSRIFSDGVGTLSWDVIDRIWDTIPSSKASPTAFQIRFRGSKGMLALDSTLEGSKVQLRPSMTKFDSRDSPVLEICDMASGPIPLVLNRQMVKILEDMGVDSKWFLDLQDIELKRLREVTVDPYSVARFLHDKRLGEGIRVHSLFRQAANMNIDWRKDPFLRSVVEAMVLRDLRLLKHKARIPVSKGITLFGIMDETGFLQENQVYVTYNPSRSGDRYEPPPNRGKVIVTRSPALHPGDIQFPYNVIPPANHPLRQLTNVIVFSRRGDRDLPSQLSGGDLDGDIYNVIWDAKAMPRSIFRPADYPRVAPLDLGREVTREDMANFFVDFIKQDILGVIATRHMILADQREHGTLDKDCLKLAQLHSTAVDFSKSGKGVELRQLPKANKYRPDFFAPGPETRVVDKSAIELDDYILEPAADEEEDQFSGARFVYYKSEKILGYLYRAVDVPKIWKEDVRSKTLPSGPSFWDEFIVKIRPRYRAVVGDIEGWADHMNHAREIREWYEGAVYEAMSQYSEHPIKPITELEVFIGNILNGSGAQTNRQRDSSMKLRDEFERISKWITRMMRKMSHDKELLTGHQTPYDSLHLCFACVYAGGKGRDRDTWKGRSYNEMQSFRVVAACALLLELSSYETGQGGGGFVGVRGNGAATARNSTRAFAAVPPPAGGFR